MGHPAYIIGTGYEIRSTQYAPLPHTVDQHAANKAENNGSGPCPVPCNDDYLFGERGILVLLNCYSPMDFLKDEFAQF